MDVLISVIGGAGLLGRDEMTTRTGEIGNCFEYDANGKRLAGQDRRTIDGMVKDSAVWPDTYHQYVDHRGYTVWAKAGVEIAAPSFSR